MKKPIPLSLLGLSPVTEGNTLAKVLDSSTCSQAEEKAGYLRFWTAEHHNMDNTASAATVVLLSNIAARTNTIRIDPGGIMLPNHAPLVIAEQFGTIETQNRPGLRTSARNGRRDSSGTPV